MFDIAMAKGVYDIGSKIIDRYMQWQSIGDNADVKVRMLYLECRRNLSLLDCVAEKKDKADDSTLLQIAETLETGILEMVFMEGESNKKLFGLLTHLPKPSKAKNVDAQKKTVVELAMSIYIKIFVLKKISGIKDKGKILKNIQYRTRLRNIKKDILTLINCIQDHQAIKGIKAKDIMNSDFNKISWNPILF